MSLHRILSQEIYLNKKRNIFKTKFCSRPIFGSRIHWSNQMTMYNFLDEICLFDALQTAHLNLFSSNPHTFDDISKFCFIFMFHWPPISCLTFKLWDIFFEEITLLRKYKLCFFFLLNVKSCTSRIELLSRIWFKLNKSITINNGSLRMQFSTFLAESAKDKLTLTFFKVILFVQM